MIIDGRLQKILQYLEEHQTATLKQLSTLNQVSLDTVRRDLARLEGIMCGISSGTNVAAALHLAQKLGPGKTVVTVLPDTAERYFSTPLFEGE